MLNEIEEFYSYVEMPQVEENAKAWVQGTFEGGTRCPDPRPCRPLFDPLDLRMDQEPNIEEKGSR